MASGTFSKRFSVLALSATVFLVVVRLFVTPTPPPAPYTPYAKVLHPLIHSDDGIPPRFCVMSISSGPSAPYCPLFAASATAHSPDHSFLYISVGDTVEGAKVDVEPCASTTTGYSNVEWLYVSALDLAGRLSRANVTVPDPPNVLKRKHTLTGYSTDGKVITLFRPLLGALFPEFIAAHGCAYWCWADTDTFFFNLSRIHDTIQDQNRGRARFAPLDMISSCYYCVNGPLTLISSALDLPALLPDYMDYVNAMLAPAGAGCVAKCCEPTECVLSQLVGLTGLPPYAEVEMQPAHRTSLFDKFRMIACSSIGAVCDGKECFSGGDLTAVMSTPNGECYGVPTLPAFVHVGHYGNITWPAEVARMAPADVYALAASGRFKFREGSLVRT